MEFLGKLLIYALAVILTAWLLPGVHIDGFITALIVAAVLSFMNAIVKPLLIILSLPVTIFSLGLFLLVINAFIILLTDRLVDGFKVDGFWSALFFSLILSIVNSLLSGFSRE